MKMFRKHRLMVSLVLLTVVHVACMENEMVAPEELDDPEVRKMFEIALGLDKPLYVQYFVWMGNVLQADFGESIHYQRPNIELIMGRFPATLLLTISATIISIVIAIPAGVIPALKRNQARST